MRKLRIALTVLLTMILSISMWTAVSASELINGTEKDEILEQFPENPQADTIEPEDEAKALEDTDTGISVPENTDAEMQILEDSDEEELEKPADFYAQFEEGLGVVTKCYASSSANSPNAYPQLYVGGEKVPAEYEGKPAYFLCDYESSDESVIGIDIFGYPTIAGKGTAVLTANIYYTQDRDLYEPYYLTSIELTVIVSDAAMTLTNMTFVEGETAEISPRVYYRVYDPDAKKWNTNYEDMSRITMEYQVIGFTPDQYFISADTRTLTIPNIPKGQYQVTATAYKDGSEIIQQSCLVNGKDAPEIDLTLTTTLSGGRILTNGVESHRESVGSSDFSLYDWGSVKFRYLDPETGEQVTWINGESYGGGTPNSNMTALKEGKVKIRGEVYRNVIDLETPIASDEVEVTAVASFNTTVIDLQKGQSFKVKPSDNLKEAGLTVTEYKSSDPSVFTVSDNGSVKAVNVGAAELNVSCSSDKGYTRKFMIPVNVYSIKLSNASAVYTGKNIKPTVTVTGPKYEYQRTSQYLERYGYVVVSGASKYANQDVKLSYAKNKNAGTAIVTAKLGNGYVTTPSFKLTFKITKAANPMTVTTKTPTASASKDTTIKKANAFTVSKAQGTVTFNKTSGNSKITVTSKGNVIVQKGLKKGRTYSVNVKVTAAGNSNYKARSKMVKLNIRISK